MLVEVSIVPLGEGRVSEDLLRQPFRDSGVRMLVGPMSSTLELIDSLELNAVIIRWA